MKFTRKTHQMSGFMQIFPMEMTSRHGCICGRSGGPQYPGSWPRCSEWIEISNLLGIPIRSGAQPALSSSIPLFGLHWSKSCKILIPIAMAICLLISSPKF